MKSGCSDLPWFAYGTNDQRKESRSVVGRGVPVFLSFAGGLKNSKERDRSLEDRRGVGPVQGRSRVC